MVINVLYGTCVFLAISYRIATKSMRGEGWSLALKSFFHGDGAPCVIKELLHRSQLCYLWVSRQVLMLSTCSFSLFRVTLVLELAMVILALSPVYQSALTVPAMALENVMTCRVHRAVILGLIADRELQTAPLMLTTLNPAIGDERWDGSEWAQSSHQVRVWNNRWVIWLQASSQSNTRKHRLGSLYHALIDYKPSSIVLERLYNRTGCISSSS